MAQEMSNAAKAAMREYQRKWRQANKDKIREINRRYWEKKAAQMMQPQEEAQQGDQN